MGTFVNPQPDSDVIQDRKEKTPVTLRSHDDGSLDFNFGNGEYINGTLRLLHYTDLAGEPVESVELGTTVPVPAEKLVLPHPADGARHFFRLRLD